MLNKPVQVTVKFPFQAPASVGCHEAVVAVTGDGEGMLCHGEVCANGCHGEGDTIYYKVLHGEAWYRHPRLEWDDPSTDPCLHTIEPYRDGSGAWYERRDTKRRNAGKLFEF